MGIGTVETTTTKGFGMRLADYVVHFLEKQGYTKAFGVTGGGAMYLNDALAKAEALQFIPMHNEQSAAMAGEGSCSVRGRGLVSLTTGPGGTNAISGCAGAWIDSQPVFFLSGQVESFSLSHSGLRQVGVQEVDIIRLVQSITKYCYQIRNPSEIRFHLEKAQFQANHERKGPVWLDIPLDVQNAQVDPDKLMGYVPPEKDKRVASMAIRKVQQIIAKLEKSHRPVLLIGNGCRHSKALKAVLSHLCLPFVTGWNGKDLIDQQHNLYMGSAGLFGNRTANFVVQNADLILGIGYRFSVPQVGYDPAQYARAAEIIAIDIDSNEFIKNENLIDIGLAIDAAEFVSILGEAQNVKRLSDHEQKQAWVDYCSRTKGHYPLDEMYNFNHESVTSGGGVNPYWLMSKLSILSPPNARYVTDMGTSFTCTHQTLALGDAQHLFTSSGLAAMGFGLPGAIGVGCESSDPVVLITGDGGFMFNLQDLITASKFLNNLKIFLLNNSGYLTMRHMQNNRFGRLIGEGPATDLEFINFEKYADICNFSYLRLDGASVADCCWSSIFDSEGNFLVEVVMEAEQPLIPRVQTVSDSSGKLYPASLEDMFPHLDTDTFDRQMLVAKLERPDFA